MSKTKKQIASSYEIFSYQSDRTKRLHRLYTESLDKILLINDEKNIKQDDIELIENNVYQQNRHPISGGLHDDMCIEGKNYNSVLYFVKNLDNRFFGKKLFERLIYTKNHEAVIENLNKFDFIKNNHEDVANILGDNMYYVNAIGELDKFDGLTNSLLDIKNLSRLGVLKYFFNDKITKKIKKIL